MFQGLLPDYFPQEPFLLKKVNKPPSCFCNKPSLPFMQDLKN
jgi:hypothetical protein